MSEENMNITEAGACKVHAGYIVSDKMQKTIVVELEDRKQHVLHGKAMRANSKAKAHDENEETGADDRVRIEERRLLPKDRHYHLIEIVEKVK